MNEVRFVDSHTEGEPTRWVLDSPKGLPAEGGPAAAAAWLNDNARSWMRAVLCEPRGHEAIVGALLLENRGLVFFNNVGCLGMCGHGTIGMAATLAQEGKARAGELLAFETPVGPVEAKIWDDGCTVSIKNVFSYLAAEDVGVEVPGIGLVRGDAAWGGNGFFLTSDCPIELSPARIPELTEWASRVKQTLEAKGLVREFGFTIDHIELTGPPASPDNSGRNFVLCPGGQFDRSPCGTGTSAKLACLAAKGELQPGEEWRQESVIGTLFRGGYEQAEGGIIPTITGRAWTCARGTLLFSREDPLARGIAYA